MSRRANRWIRLPAEARLDKAVKLLQEALAAHEEKHPDWLIDELRGVARLALVHLRYYIESDPHGEVGWADPSVDLEHKVGWDWKAGEVVHGVLNAEDLVDDHAVIEALAAIAPRHLECMALSFATDGLHLRVRAGATEVHVPEEARAGFLELPEEERQAVVDELFAPRTYSILPARAGGTGAWDATRGDVAGIVAPGEEAGQLGFRGAVGDVAVGGHIELAIRPLVVHMDRREVYFPVSGSVFFDPVESAGEVRLPDPAGWTQPMRAQFWDEVVGFGGTSAEAMGWVDPNEFVRAEALPRRRRGRTPVRELAVPSNPQILAALRATCAGGRLRGHTEGGWRENVESRAPLYVHEVPGLRGRVEIRVAPRLPARQADAVELWGVVRRLDPFALDVMVAVLAQICAGADPRSGVTIGGDAVLAHLGVRGGRHERLDALRRVAAALEDLQRLECRIDVRSIARSGTRIAWAGPLFRARPAPDGGPFTWDVKPGEWFEEWFASPRAPWVARVSAALLKLQRKKTAPAARLAKKIGIHLLLERPYIAGPRELQVRTLLACVGELPEPDARKGYDIGRIRGRLDAALELLESHGVIGSHFHDLVVGAEDEHRRRGQAAAWLDSKVRIAFPGSAEPARRAADPRTKKVRRRRARKQTNLFEEVKRRRIELGLRQEDVARRFLGVSVPALSFLERGLRRAGPQVRAKAAAWLDGTEGEAKARQR